MSQKDRKRKRQRNELMARGIACRCGHFERFTMDVYANWYERLSFTCQCGRQYEVFAGLSKMIYSPVRIEVIR